jgi:hypothetical protein
MLARSRTNFFSSDQHGLSKPDQMQVLSECAYADTGGVEFTVAWHLKHLPFYRCSSAKICGSEVVFSVTPCLRGEKGFCGAEYPAHYLELATRIERC